MSKFCSNCGRMLEEGEKFCKECGNNTEGTTINQTINNSSRPKLPERNVVLAVLFSIITCGIYSLYWFIVMTDESNLVSDEKTASGGMALLYTIISCGIYGIYWYYKMGQKLGQAGKKYDMPIADNSFLYLVLALFGFGIISDCLIQSDLNKFAK